MKEEFIVITLTILLMFELILYFLIYIIRISHFMWKFNSWSVPAINFTATASN